MEKKKIIFLNNHFQYSDGTVQALIGLVNSLDLEKYDITIKPIYRCDYRLQSELKKEIKLEKGFGFYFRGFSKLVKIFPIKWLYRKFIGGKYDIEVGFQCDLPTRLIGYSENKKAVHVAWMHGYGLYPYCYQNCDKVVCVSKYCADKAKSEMGDSINVTYCYNLIDDLKILSKANENVENFSGNHPIFVSVGRHSPEKGYLRLIKIFFELKNEGYGFHLILVGDGPQHVEIKKLVKDLGMNEYITLTGAQKNPHKYTSKSDVFICSSFNEGYSTACTEAAVLGIPIITTNVPGGEEIIKDCECGILTSMEDKDLKNAIKTVLDNPNLINEWKNILKVTNEKFKLSMRKKAINALFDEFVALSEQKKEIYESEK